MNPYISQLFDEIDFINDVARNANAGNLFIPESIRPKLLTKIIDNTREIALISDLIKTKKTEIPEPWASMTAKEIIKELGVYR